MEDPVAQFKKEREEAVEEMARDKELHEKSIEWMVRADRYKYTYNFSWLGRPIIKFPNDVMVMQEIIWEVKPDLIIETGIAHGGSIIFSASMLELLGGNGRVVAVDNDIRAHNRKLIEEHPMMKRITMLEADSVSEETVAQVREFTKGRKKVMVFLDSLHTHDHVYKEMKAYGPMVTKGSYMVLPDTFIEYFPRGYYSNRPWDVGNNPMTALRQFMKEDDSFEIDRHYSGKLAITEAFDGYLKKVK